ADAVRVLAATARRGTPRAAHRDRRRGTVARAHAQPRRRARPVRELRVDRRRQPRLIREGLIRDEARTRTVRAFPPCVAPSQGGPLGVAEIVPTGVTPVIRPSAARPLAPAARVHGRRQATRRPGGRWGASRTAAANFGREIA